MAYSNFNSRTADKFVVRMPDGMRENIEKLATDNHTSMNTEIILAIEAHLEGQARQRLLLDALEARLAQKSAVKPEPIKSDDQTNYLDGLRTGTR